MIKNYKYDFGWVYVPTDSKALETIYQLENLTWEGAEFEGVSKVEEPNENDEFIDLPIYEYDLFNQITDVLIKEWVNNNLPENDFDLLIDSLHNSNYLVKDSNEHKEIVKHHLQNIYNEKASINKDELTRKELLSKIDSLVGSMASKIVRNSKVKSINGQVIGDLKKTINGRYVYESKTFTKEMTFNELKDKLNWLNNLSSTINELKTIPVWLQK